MVGMADRTISPSSSSTRRSTPCVLGCCGPILTVIVSLRSSATSMRPFQAIAFEVGPEFFFADFKRLVGLCRLANLDGIVLPLGMSFPVLRHQKTAQIRMPAEDDTEHVPDFP